MANAENISKPTPEPTTEAQKVQRQKIIAENFGVAQAMGFGQYIRTIETPSEDKQEAR